MQCKTTRSRWEVVVCLFCTLMLTVTQNGVGNPGKTPKPDEQLLAAEQILSDLGYWVLKIDGIRDSSTYHAIIAFQKVERIEKTGRLSPGLLEHLQFASKPIARFNTNYPHVEIDITRQVLFLTDPAGIIVKILPVSTGNEERYFDQGKWQIAHTPRGAFHITRQVKGVRHASLGDLYYPNYFYGGVAIHGSLSVPATPASHGCVRIPRFADKDFNGLVWVGMEVFVYD
jgi:hypothetical protein